MPPETTDYMILGYVITVLILAGLVGYLVMKARSLRAELKMLKALEAEGEAPQKAGSVKAREEAPRGV
jgi:hypothetical protein